MEIKMHRTLLNLLNSTQHWKWEQIKLYQDFKTKTII